MTSTPARRFPWLLLAYLGPLAIIPLIVMQWGGRGTGASADVTADRMSVQWHAWQGFLLAVIETLVLGGVSLLAGYVALANVAAGVTLGVLAWLLWAATLALHFAALVAALTDRRLDVPVVGTLASRLVTMPPR